MQLTIKGTITEDIAGDGLILVSNEEVHILNDTARSIYSIIKEKSPTLKELVSEYSALYKNEWTTNNDEMVSDLLEMLLQFKDRNIIEIR